ncbi:hypothetical protein C8046_03520 [Serinibacter arcticus]|uniref:AMIN-like domain-containing protein n=1 Tax=Serinibacter arcticus TaxID=1655435 RepID=A0A2U1ZSC8_9MICO|nr:hypothetical protein [Serinibacter arcticus]PWD49889.1 hypothetical protein C8046_03520 [Serinibacter arcticus]
MTRTNAAPALLVGALVVALAACTGDPSSESSSTSPSAEPTSQTSAPSASPETTPSSSTTEPEAETETETDLEVDDACPASEDSGINFLDLGYSGELQPRPDDAPYMQFESFNSSVCPDGSHRVVVTLVPFDGGGAGEVGLWSDLTETAMLDSGEIADIDGDQVLNISVNGIARGPDDGEAPDTPVDEGGTVAEAMWYATNGGSASLLLGLGEASQFRAFTLTDPFRVVVDVLP